MDKKKILIVDDEMDVRLVLQKSLASEGYSAITARNGIDALSLAKVEHPDLIILDRILGDMLGEEVAAKLQEHPKTKDIPVIFISALFSKTDEIDKDHSFGGNVMFAKPYNTEELMTAINKFL